MVNFKVNWVQGYPKAVASVGGHHPVKCSHRTGGQIIRSLSGAVITIIPSPQSSKLQVCGFLDSGTYIAANQFLWPLTSD